MFKKDKYKDGVSFGKWINGYFSDGNLPACVATKYVANHKELKDYDIKCCEGRYKGYQYYFPIVEADKEKFVFDLGNHIDNNKIEPIIIPLEQSDYRVKKIMSVSEFNNKFDSINNEYNGEK
ncbi:hypothetical protein KY334_05475 [Candidatus Woesearchaeota archaeon]|nr:hypothetical protein [Candidatus Woesearchaeota archaeon]